MSVGTIHRDTLRIAEVAPPKVPSRGRGRGLVTRAAEAWVLEEFQRYGQGRAWLTPSLIKASAQRGKIGLPGMDSGRPFPGDERTRYRTLARCVDRNELVRIAGPRGRLYTTTATARTVPTALVPLLRDVPSLGVKAAYWVPNVPGIDAIATVAIFDDEASALRFGDDGNRTRKRWTLKGRKVA